MIEFINQNKTAPYILLKQKYDEALDAGQKNIEAISISSFDTHIKEVNARFVNLKFVDDKSFIFFSNYDSPKSKAFNSHDQISATFFWSSTYVQIRMKAKINQTSSKYNNEYFKKRSPDKNALAICSSQSQKILSYEDVLSKYDDTIKNDDLQTCPEYWGGYSFVPYYFEFWEGHDSRLNKREVYEIKNSDWVNYFLQP